MPPAIEIVSDDNELVLRPLTQADAEAHLAGDDDDHVRWLSGAKSTIDHVRAFIDESAQQWTNGGPRRSLGVFARAGGALLGTVEVNGAVDALAHEGTAGNISYSVQPAHRGRGVAARAVTTLVNWLVASRDEPITHVVIRVDARNARSVKVARDAGFALVDDGEPEGGGRGPRPADSRDPSSELRFELVLRGALYVHGVGGGASLFDDVRAKHAGRAVDLPASLTSAEALADALAARVHPSAHVVVVGHSMGGAVAQEFARRHPNKVRALALVSTALRFPAASTMRAMLRADRDAFALAFKDALGPAPKIPRSLALFDGHDDASIDAALAVCEGFDARERPPIRDAATGALRAVVLCGSADRVVPPKAAKRLAETLGCPYVEIDGKEHMLPEEAADDVVAAISTLIG